MMHKLLAELFMDALGLMAAEVDTPEQAEEVKAILFGTAEGDATLAMLETALGLTLAPVELVQRYWELGPRSVEVAWTAVEARAVAVAA